MTDPALPFTDHKPPPGGLQRLQQSLVHERPAPIRWTAQVAGAAAFALAIGVLCLVPGWWAQHQRDQRLASAVQRAIAPPRKGIEVSNGTAIALPSGQADVQLYLVQQTPAGSARPTSPSWGGHRPPVFLYH